MTTILLNSGFEEGKPVRASAYAGYEGKHINTLLPK
jgi:hypothetical protein